MKARYWLIWILGVIIVLTLLFNFISGFSASCTLIGCPCQNWVEIPGTPSGNITGERPCNTCTLANPVFVSILFNVVRHCEYKEIIICEDGESVGKRYDKENKVCRYDPYVLIFNLGDLGSYNRAVSHNVGQMNGASFPGGGE
ncbi:MAG: hypothetical protein KJ600_01120 [Nanoarchaeota archaeon]|nr:hypothetical protein [Nanoarchaeota archaeon]MBU1103143.1 hypothetical protein [Nanoarchaeota archaeon]MBU1988760.1 hypothetical protein [Nanoarchaeota archaeon]